MYHVELYGIKEIYKLFVKVDFNDTFYITHMLRLYIYDLF